MTSLLIGLALALAVTYALLLVALLVAAPPGATVKESVRLLPHLVGLIHRLARDPAVPRAVRARLWLLMAYLALPFDLVPDVIPVLGYADDAILVALTLRSVARRAGPQTLRRQWPGSDEGFAVLVRLTGLSAPAPR